MGTIAVVAWCAFFGGRLPRWVWVFVGLELLMNALLTIELITKP